MASRSRYNDPESSQLHRQINDLERRIRALEHGTQLGNSSITRGGLAIRGGGSFTVSDGGDISVADGGDVGVVDGGNVNVDGGNVNVFGTDSRIHVTGGGDIAVEGGGSMLVAGGGDIQVDGGRFQATDDAGDVFVVDTEPANIFMRQELISQLALNIFAEQILVDSTGVQSSFTTSTGGYVDHSSSGQGPEIEDIVIGESGRMLVFVSGNIGISATNDTVTTSIVARMGYSVTDETPTEVVAPLASTSLALGSSLSGVVGATSWSTSNEITGTAVSLVTLDPGVYNVTAKYFTTILSGSGFAGFSGLLLMVIPF